MGSKRVDQVHKDLLSTDRKSRPQDEHIIEESKQLLQSSPEKTIPERGENPALEELKEKRAAAEGAGEGD